VLGEFTWQITLDWGRDPLQLRGDWNPIVTDASQMGGKWSGDGQSVVIREVRKGIKATIRGLPSPDEVLRANFTNQPLSSPDTPAYTVKGLLPLTLYQFRVRPINTIGAGDWSVVSPRIRTKAVSVPSDTAARFLVVMFWCVLLLTGSVWRPFWPLVAIRRSCASRKDARVDRFDDQTPVAPASCWLPHAWGWSAVSGPCSCGGCRLCCWDWHWRH
jgi:hypothetical protein